MRLPPTPTPYPAPPENIFPVEVPDYRLWDFADDAIQAWNRIPVFWTQVLQGAMLMGLVIFGVFVVVGVIRSMSNEEPSDEG